VLKWFSQCKNYHKRPTLIYLKGFMFRSFFIYLSKAAWARNIITRWGVMRRLATRFVAGDKLEDAISVIKTLNQRGICASLDLLGENTTTPDEARKTAHEIINILETINQTGVRANVSVKLTQIGLALDTTLCVENLGLILEQARQFGNFVRVDMEDSKVTQVTLDIVCQMREKGYLNVGIVIQSYLYRSDKDIARLVSGGIPVRLCKGAYKEPSSVAYPKKHEVDVAYDRLTAALLDGANEHNAPAVSSDGRTPPLPALATHDVRRINYAKNYAGKINLPKTSLEFQMLYGIRRDIQDQLATEGFPVRVYVPYGTQWYPYNMRRLAERPANVWFIVSNFFRK
jgi:proline dehydrogenase